MQNRLAFGAITSQAVAPGGQGVDHFDRCYRCRAIMRHPDCVADPETLSIELQKLTALTAKDLKVRYRSLYRSEPPPGLSRNLLLRALAYRLQEAALGGLNRSTRRRLAKAASGRRRLVQAAANDARQSAAAPTLRCEPAPGTVLIREWHGVAHHVTVLVHGVHYGGEHYRSLSQVARLITGTRWSGPAFFGLRGKHGKR